MAQARQEQPRVEAREQGAGPPVQVDADAPQEAPQEAPHRSAFGRVMALMIDALQTEAMGDEANSAPATARDAKAAAGVRTTAIGTPLGIEVGEAFRLDARPATTSMAARRKAKATEMPLAVQAGQAEPGL
jgi:hypothetical protein